MTDSATAGAATQALGGQTTQTTTPDTGATQTHVQAAAPPASAEWTKDWAPEDAGAVEKKGWKSPADLFKSYREMEKKFSSDNKIPLPKDENDTAAYDAILARLGRPDSPDKYQFGKDADPSFVKAFAPLLHKGGMSQKAAAELEAGWNAFAAQQHEVQTQGWLKDQEKAMQVLQNEWGPNINREIEHNRTAMRAVGMTVEEANVFMRGGSEKFLRLLNMAGKSKGIVEDNSASMVSEDALGFNMTANRAAAEIADLKRNPEKMRQVFKAGTHENRRWKDLHKIASP